MKEVLNNGLVQRMKEKLVSAKNRRTELLKKYLEKHPDIVVVDRQIKRMNEALEREVAGIHAALEREWQAARRSEEKLAIEVTELRDKAKEIQSHELAYRRLQGLAESKKTLHQEMLARLKEAQLQADSRANNVRVLDAALVPSGPISPRPLLNLLLGVFVALVGGVGLAFLMESLDNTVKDQTHLEGVGLTFLSHSVITLNEGTRGLPREVSNPDRCVIDHPNSTGGMCTYDKNKSSIHDTGRKLTVYACYERRAS